MNYRNHEVNEMKNYSRGSLNRVMYAEDPYKISTLESCMESLYIFPYFFSPDIHIN